MDITRDEKTWLTQRNIEKIRREGNERTWLDLGTCTALGNRQTLLAFVGGDLMCCLARRGLSKLRPEAMNTT